MCYRVSGAWSGLLPLLRETAPRSVGMKVLDLQCSHGHSFEGWFSSEEDFSSQLGRGLVQCPLCADASVVKRPSAPRLSLSGVRRSESTPDGEMGRSSEMSLPADNAQIEKSLLSAWLAVTRQVMEKTSDVGAQFAEEARKMHYGEREYRGIRGTTTVSQARELLEEGIEVMPLLVPDALKGPLQ